MGPFPFLSDDWVEQARKLKAEYGDRSSGLALDVRMNLVVTEVPFGDGTRNAHLDTTSGEMVVELEHLDEPDVTVTLDYDTAKAILVEQNPQAGMQAFMAGKIRIDGDMSKLLALQVSPSDPVHAEIAEKVREMTA